MATATDKDEPLKRLGGGRWATRDARFTIEPQSGTWVVVDAEQTDDLGLPLVRGPFGSLRDAKAAIEFARESEPAASPLIARVEELRSRPAPETAPGDPPAPTTPPAPALLPEHIEPRWLTDLAADDRRRARRLIERLSEAGAPEPEGTARRDIVGNVATTASYAVVRAIVALGPDASPAAIAGLLEDGRDAALGVRWRLVDGDGRPISLDLSELGPAG